jgi:hypothetical protein
MKASQALIFCLIFLTIASVTAQGEFFISGNREDRVVVPFKLVNNMMVIEADVNGRDLSFLVDTGIRKTVLFNVLISDSLSLKNVKTVPLRGLGEGNTVSAVSSNGNLFRCNGIVNPGLSLFMITDNLFDLSAKMGIDIHGIIGGDLFQDFVVKINYASQKLIFFDPETFEYPKCKNCESFPLDFYGGKPYIDVYVTNQSGTEHKVKLLIDSGGGDSLWLFPESDPNIFVPEKNFDDYLGRGLSGDIYGKRAKLKEIRIGNFFIFDANVSYPDSTSMVTMYLNKDRNGTLGAGILKRFHVIMDYKNSRITLKKNNKYYNEPFLYNKSGIEIVYGGEMLVKEKRTRLSEVEGQSGASILDIIYSYGLTYKPSYKISVIRRGSPAHLAGLREGDIILEINGKAAYMMKMEEVIQIFSQEADKRIRMLVDRNGQHLNYQFQLKSLL